MAKAEKLIPFILQWEGGFVAHPADRGGATNRGVTMAVYAAYRRTIGQTPPTVQDLRALPQAVWNDLFRRFYWDRCEASALQSQSLANLLVDWFWCSGGVAVRVLQRLVEEVPDGVMGPRTLRAVHARDARLLFLQMHQERKRFLEAIVQRDPSQRLFLQGWMNRLRALTFADDE